ncbi:EamA family transporter [Thalassobacillus devorans]|uniref:EamA family transporter n=1 Tax=Thalassobacillus devorans TaxID=279813 RepID=A0ABQ1NFK6_9BACI|nr:DMT family transporter [Thalassobacillus devorans]NIK27181.1 drug/metabolite transporter (DMT)-like permease [Thalassobacillus devorans]GGC75670.1 EamA family transporter [Thalassobacillus devorans]
MNRLWFTILLVTTTSLMGSSFAVGKIGLNYVSPLLLVGLRFSIAGSIMALSVYLLKRQHPKRFKAWLQMLVVGFFQTAAVMGAIFLSLRTITAGESSILTFTNPLLVVLFGTIFMGMKYRWMQWGGVAIGFLGVFITLGASLDIQQTGTLLGMMSAVSWAIATLLMKKWGQAFDTWVLTAYQMLFGGVILLIGSALMEQATFVVTPLSIFILIWLAIMASIVQFAIWFYLLKREDPGKVSAFLFLAPLFGVIFGWLLLNEQLHFSTLIGGSLILAGIYFVNRPAKQVRTRLAAGPSQL